MSGRPRLSDEGEFIELVRTLGIAGTAKRLGITTGSVYERRERIEKRTGQQIAVPDWRSTRFQVNHPGLLRTTLLNGTAIVGSDAHNWPGPASTAHRAYIWACETLKPQITARNGDELDGASISRHPPIGWEDRPSVIQELEANKERLGEIIVAAPKAERYWMLGNHDGRFETRLATVAPEYARVHGMHLHDHFPDWRACWALQINEDVIIKHRYKGGIHATHNNTLWSGKTVVTGHLHSLKVTPFSDYNGTRFGVDCGTLAEPYGPQFADYTELNPVNWRSGFVVLTFRDGRLLWPEVVHVLDEQSVEFRGSVINV